MKKIFLFIFLIFIMFSLVEGAFLDGDCTIRYGGGAVCSMNGEIGLFLASDYFNAHASLGTGYNYYVCCPGTDLNFIGNAPTANVVGMTVDFGEENAHVYAPENAYDPGVIVQFPIDGQGTDDVDCVSSDTGSPGADYHCVVSISDNVNAHVSNCTGSGSYPLKVYCKVQPSGGSSCEIFGAYWCNGIPIGGCYFENYLNVNESDKVWLAALGPDCNGLDLSFNVFENDDGAPNESIGMVGANITVSSLAYVEWIVPYIPGSDGFGNELHYQFKVNETTSGNYGWSQILNVTPICDSASACFIDSGVGECAPYLVDSCRPLVTPNGCNKSQPVCYCMYEDNCGSSGSSYGPEVIIRIRNSTECADDGDGDNIGIYDITLQYFNTSSSQFIGNFWVEDTKPCFLDKDIPFYGLFSLILTILLIGVYYKRKSFKKN